MKTENMETETTNVGIDGGNAIEGGNVPWDANAIEIKLKQCPHESLCQLEEGMMMLCHECTEHHGVNVWIYDPHAVIVNKHLEWLWSRNPLSTYRNLRHLENLMLYIQSHIHHPKNTWGQGGLNYWDWTGQGAE
tara:strand:- start:1761 stop:2162 length:402 start_codon:yes stop_codon:yes gene_type:complete